MRIVLLFLDFLFIKMMALVPTSNDNNKQNTEKVCDMLQEVRRSFSIRSSFILFDRFGMNFVH